MNRWHIAARLCLRRVRNARYTGFKSSPYTEGALFYGEKLLPGQARDDVASLAEPAPALLTEPACEPGST